MLLYKCKECFNEHPQDLDTFLKKYIVVMVQAGQSDDFFNRFLLPLMKHQALANRDLPVNPDQVINLTLQYEKEEHKWDTTVDKNLRGLYKTLFYICSRHANEQDVCARRVQAHLNVDLNMPTKVYANEQAKTSALSVWGLFKVVTLLTGAPTMFEVTNRVQFMREPPIAGDFSIKLVVFSQHELEIAFKAGEDKTGKSFATLDMQTDGMDEWANETHVLKLVFNMNALMQECGTISG